uniref:ATP synthase complex subunit 8 n=1 Tax=Phraortes similis TaxID=3127883 RepID=A0AAU7YTY2_9NEOP
MPQMSPMSWITIYMMIIIIMMMFNTKIYFQKTNNLMKNTNKTSNSKENNWKW